METESHHLHRHGAEDTSPMDGIQNNCTSLYNKFNSMLQVRHIFNTLQCHRPFLTSILLIVICCQFVTPAKAAVITVALFSSGNGIEGDEGVNAFPCDICLDEILSQLEYNSPAPCNQVARLTECFEQCTPQVSEGEDDSNIRQLLMLTQISEILSILKAKDCEVSEDLAPGCSVDVLDCVQPIVQRSAGYPYDITKVECSEDALISVLQCTGNTPDCEWRSQIEMIASHGRRSVCGADDKCLSGNLLFVAGEGCKTYRMVDVNDVVSLLTQPPMSVAPGTLFDATACGLKHASAVSC